MSHKFIKDPPIGEEPECESEAYTTNCDGDTTDNYWVQGKVCLLDSMRLDQIVYAIERNPFARRDLARVTRNPELLDLLDKTPMLPPAENPTKTAVSVNADAYYTIFQGKPPYRQK